MPPQQPFIAPPLQEPMGNLPQNTSYFPSPLSSPQTQQQNISSPPEVHQAPPRYATQPQYFDGEMSKSEPQAHSVTNAKHMQEGQPGQQQPQSQPGNMAYPGAGIGRYQTAIPLANLGRVPAPVDCPRCNARGLTDCESESGGFTHVLALALCCVCCLGCIPYCVDGTKDVRHKCGACKNLLAVWHRSNSMAAVVAYK